MLTPIYKNKFEKDIKRLKKRGKDLTKLAAVMRKIVNEEELEKKYKDHSLKGEYADCRECHIEPDWLFIYMPHNPHVTFVRSGTHADLFK
jgi:mRNA interferase YafQ